MELWLKLTTAIVPRDTGPTGRKESYLANDFVHVAFPQPEYQTYAGIIVVVTDVVAKGTDPVAYDEVAGCYCYGLVVYYNGPAIDCVLGTW